MQTPTRGIFEHLPEGYSERLANRTAMRQLGFWLEQLQIGDQPMFQQLEVRQDRDYAPLDPGGPDEGPRAVRRCSWGGIMK